MQCPLCTDETLRPNYRAGIEIDICPRCRGVWLDRGELDRLVAEEPTGSPATPAPAAPAPAPIMAPPSAPPARSERPERPEKKKPKKKKKGRSRRLADALEDLFDDILD